MTDQNQIQGDGTGEQPPAPPQPSAEELRNKFEEEKRKREAAEQEREMLRDQNLRIMAQQYQQQNNPPPAPAAPPPEDEDIQSLDPIQRRAFEKMLAAKEQQWEKKTETVARRTFQQDQIRNQAKQMYPDLNNPNSEFFKKVAFFMDTHPQKYNDPEGIFDACARVSLETGYTPNRNNGDRNEMVRRAQSNAATNIQGSSGSQSDEYSELDPKGTLLASKLGIDPKKMAQRLADMQTGKGVYAPAEGKTGKASLR